MTDASTVDRPAGITGAAPTASATGRRHREPVISLGRVSIARANVAWLAAVVVLLLAGVTLRIAQYLSGRPLGIDEARLAIEIAARSPAQLVETLSFGQSAPALFLLLEDGMTAATSGSDAMLTVLPLAAGIATIVVVAAFAWRVVAPPVAVTATALVALSEGLIAYSSQVKPYASDALAAVVVAWLATTVADTRLTRRRAFLAAAGGALAILLSFPAIFVGASGVIAIAWTFRAERERLRLRALPVGLWVVAMAASGIHAWLTTTTIQDAFYASADSGATPRVLPAGLANPGDALDTVDAIGSELSLALALPQSSPWSLLAKVGALLAAVGAVSLARRRPALGITLTLPFVFALIAVRLERYPVTTRTMLFLVPLLAVLLSTGIWTLARWPGRGRVGVIVGVALSAILLVAPAVNAWEGVRDPRPGEPLPWALQQVAKGWRPGDRLFVHYAAQYAFRHYRECDCFELRPAPAGEPWRFLPLAGDSSEYAAAWQPIDGSLVRGSWFGSSSDAIDRNLDEILSLDRNRRTWIVFSHYGFDDDERRLLFETLPAALRREGSLSRADTNGTAGVYLREAASRSE